MALRRFTFALSRTIVRRPLIWARHLGLDSSDVMLASYPKSGNTWFRFLLAEALSDACADFDNIDDLVPQIGLHERAAALLPGKGRLIKTHEPYRRQYRKAIFLVRDVRSVMVSLYSRGSRMGVFDHLSFDTFVPMFLEGRSANTGSWQAHVRSWLGCPLPREGRLLIVRYEDMRRDPHDALARTLQFLGCAAHPGRIARAIEANTLENMREKEDRSQSFPQPGDDQGRFVRQGAISGWREHFSSAQLELVKARAGAELQLLGYSANTA